MAAVNRPLPGSDGLRQHLPCGRAIRWGPAARPGRRRKEENVCPCFQTGAGIPACRNPQLVRKGNRCSRLVRALIEPAALLLDEPSLGIAPPGEAIFERLWS